MSSRRPGRGGDDSSSSSSSNNNAPARKATEKEKRPRKLAAAKIPLSEAATAVDNAVGDHGSLSDAARDLLATGNKITSWMTDGKPDDAKHDLLEEILRKKGKQDTRFDILRVHKQLPRHCLAELSTGELVFCYIGPKKKQGKTTEGKTTEGKTTEGKKDFDLESLRLDPKEVMIPRVLKEFFRSLLLNKNPLVFADGKPKFIDEDARENGKPRWPYESRFSVDCKETLGKLGNLVFHFKCGVRKDTDTPMKAFLSSKLWKSMLRDYNEQLHRAPKHASGSEIDRRLAFDFPQPSLEKTPSCDRPTLPPPPPPPPPSNDDDSKQDDGDFLGGSRGGVAVATSAGGHASPYHVLQPIRPYAEPYRRTRSSPDLSVTVASRAAAPAVDERRSQLGGERYRRMSTSEPDLSVAAAAPAHAEAAVGEREAAIGQWVRIRGQENKGRFKVVGYHYYELEPDPSDGDAVEYYENLTKKPFRKKKASLVLDENQTP